MSTQPEALRLAERLETHHPLASPNEEAAAELRRLHAANQELVTELKKVREVIAAWNQSFIETVTNQVTGLIDDPNDVLTAEADQDLLNGIDAAIEKATTPNPKETTTC